ncbi:MAG: methyltransferase domain-containing protein [Gemmatimonadaceae bacterium]|nr:methyltransferase domain-containing protein [Gloeobacterales cyanobacterium ES-bin-141]
MQNPQKAKEDYFDHWAASYDAFYTAWLYRWCHARLLARVHLQASHVLDLGCGTGCLLRLLAKRFGDLRGVGLDLSERMVSQACQRNHAARLSFVQGNAEVLPFAAAQFDAVFSTFSFQHYLHPEQVVQEVRRVLRPGGYFYWVDTSVGERTGHRTIAMTPGGLRLYSPESRHKLGIDAGLVCISHHSLLGPVLLSTFVG